MSAHQKHHHRDKLREIVSWVVRLQILGLLCIVHNSPRSFNPILIYPLCLFNLPGVCYG